METGHGPALSWREQRVLGGIEQELRSDEELDLVLRTMRLRRRRWPHLRRHRGDDGHDLPTAGAAPRGKEHVVAMPSESRQSVGAGEAPFTVEESVSAREALLRLTGDLEHDTAPVLRGALARCDDAHSARILVDCTALAFCDSTGLNLLLGARAGAQARGAEIALVGLSPTVARVFEVTGAAALFPRYASVEEARTRSG
jgi:anti-anti-sigma factor